MTKTITLLFTFTLMLMFVACGGNSTFDKENVNNASTNMPRGVSTTAPEEESIDKNDTKLYLGTWEREFTINDNENIKQTLSIYKGGTGRFVIHHYNGERDSDYTATWEITDEVLNFSYGSFITLGLEIDTSSIPISLVEVANSNAIFYKVGNNISQAADSSEY